MSRRSVCCTPIIIFNASYSLIFIFLHIILSVVHAALAYRDLIDSSLLGCVTFSSFYLRYVLQQNTRLSVLDIWLSLFVCWK